MIKAIIIDNETSAVKIIRSFCNKSLSPVEVIASHTSLQAGLSLIRKKKPDLLFLNINLPEHKDTDLLAAIQRMELQTILLTTKKGLSLDTIKQYAFDHLLKPIDFDEFQQVMTMAVEKIKAQKRLDHMDIDPSLSTNPFVKIAIPETSGTIYVRPQEVIRIQADGAYSRVYFSNGKSQLVSRMLKNFENALYPHGFLRVHRSHIVNLHHVISSSKLEGGFLVMSNQDKIPIARKNREQVNARLRNHALFI